MPGCILIAGLPGSSSPFAGDKRGERLSLPKKRRVGNCGDAERDSSATFRGIAAC